MFMRDSLVRLFNVFWFLSWFLFRFLSRSYFLLWSLFAFWVCFVLDFLWLVLWLLWDNCFYLRFMIILLGQSVFWLIFYLRFWVNTFFCFFFYYTSSFIGGYLIYLFWLNWVEFLELKLRFNLISVVDLMVVRFDNTFLVEMDLLSLGLYVSILHFTILHFHFELDLSLFVFLQLFGVIFDASDKGLVCFFIVLFKISYLIIQWRNQLPFLNIFLLYSLVGID